MKVVTTMATRDVGKWSISRQYYPSTVSELEGKTTESRPEERSDAEDQDGELTCFADTLAAKFAFSVSLHL